MTSRADVRDRESLLAAVRSGMAPNYLFFWGHRPSADGSIGKSCLSQWWPSPFTIEGVTYATAEHWMMAGKARLFGDEEAARRVLADPDPRAAKAAGRAVRGFDERAWAAERGEIVYRGNLAKFGQHEPLGRFLLGTGDRVLVEASPDDAVWGIGLRENHRDAAAPERWPGLNLLGFALMRVRAALRSR